MKDDISASRPAPRTGVLRTPESCFEGIDDYPWLPGYFEVEPGLCMAYIDVGPKDAAETLLLLHGEPMWGYLYHKMIPVFEQAGYRVVVPDLIGFGRSDKPIDPEAYTYSNHVAWLTCLLEHLDLRGATIFGQDWGGLLGGRVLAENIERFSRAVFSNTDLPGSTMFGLPGLKPQERLPPEVLQSQFGIDWRATLGEGDAIDREKVLAFIKEAQAPYFLSWRVYSQEVDELLPSRIVPGLCLSTVSDASLRAYDAPFPSQEYTTGARRFPLLVPITTDDPERVKNDAAWSVLERWQRPVLTLWGDVCPFTYTSLGKPYRERIPGAGISGINHQVFHANHFIQEDIGEVVAEEMTRFIRQFPAD